MQLRARIGSCVVAFVALVIAAIAPSFAASSGNVTVSWYSQAILNATLTPNYASGFGAVKATFGAQPAPTHGPDACQNGCYVDFGSVLAGDQYLYKYAAHINVVSNDTNGVALFGQGAADFVNSNDGTSQTLNTTLYYLTSTSGSIADGNTGYSSGLPFQNAALTPGATVNNNSFSTTPSITYSPALTATSTNPSPIASSTAATADFYYDYQLRVPPAATSGLYYVWVVYTVVAK